jgi:hypothetical protein
MATWNTKLFLSKQAEQSAADSVTMLAEMMTYGQFDMLALQELGLSDFRTKFARRVWSTYKLHMITASDHPKQETCALLLSHWWYVHCDRSWRHASGRAMVVDFRLTRGKRIRIGVVYGYSGAERQASKADKMQQLLKDLTEHLQEGRTQSDSVFVLRDFNLHLVTDQGSGGTSDYPYPGHLESWAEKLGLQHVAVAWQANMLTRRVPQYSHLQNTGPSRTSITLLDHIWTSVEDVQSLTAYGITKAGLLDSDHCLVFCDWQQNLVASNWAARKKRMSFQTKASKRVFPCSQNWSPTIWESWTQQVDEKTDMWRSILVSTEQLHTHSTTTRHELDILWNRVEDEISSISQSFTARKERKHKRRSKEEYVLWRRIMNHSCFKKECSSQVNSGQGNISLYLWRRLCQRAQGLCISGQ